MGLNGKSGIIRKVRPVGFNVLNNTPVLKFQPLRL